MLAELQLMQETNQAVSELFTAIAALNATVSLGAENAVKSSDLKVIQSLTWILEAMTRTLQTRKPQMPRTRPRMDA